MKGIVKHVNISELKTGMVLAKDIEQNGTIVMKQGLELTEITIEKLKRIYVIGSIDVYVKESEEISKNRKDIEFNKIENEFVTISNKLEETFDKVFSSDNDFISDIQDFSTRIKEKIKSQDLVIKNIVLHGSGSDVIYRHGVNVAALCTLLGVWLNMSEEEIKLLVYAAMLHDCGKTKIDSKILDKPGRLTENEYNEIKNNSALGYNILQKLQYLDKNIKKIQISYTN